MTWLTRRTLEHTDWCAGGHLCGMSEHRSDPHVVDVDGVGRLVLTRVLDADGRQHAEVRISAVLGEHDVHARRRLEGLLHRLVTALGG